MKKISIFKKIKLFKDYKRAIEANTANLEEKFFIRKDKADRLYTVLNIPKELIGEAYDLKKSDIDRISQNYIKQYMMELGKTLDIMGLNELYSTYKIEKVGKYSYLLVIGFSLFKSNKYYNRLYYMWPPVILLTILTALFFLL